MEYFDIELIYQHLKDNYPSAEEIKKLSTKEYHHPKFCHFEMNSIIIFDENGIDWEELWQEDFETHEEVFEKIYELAVTRPTIYRDYLLAKQRDKRIDDILSD